MKGLAAILGVFTLSLAACSSDSPTQPSNQEIPNVQGQWSGVYVVQSCSESGSRLQWGFTDADAYSIGISGDRHARDWIR
jgi:hypothetical protein